MEKDDSINKAINAPKGFLSSDALLKIKALVWTNELDVLLEAIDGEEKELSSIHVELLRLQRDKKKCYKQLLELSLALQDGKDTASAPIEACKKELETLTEAIEVFEYKRDMFPTRVSAIESELFQKLIETIYHVLDEARVEQHSVVTEIAEIRSVLKEKWTQKFDLDAKMASLDGYLHGVLGKDELDALDEALLQGKES